MNIQDISKQPFNLLMPLGAIVGDICGSKYEGKRKGIKYMPDTLRTKIPEYMNSQQSKCLYIINTNTTQTSICTAIYNTITNDEVPTFMSIENTTGSNWYYSTSGHCLINNGIYSDYSKILFSDPLGGTQAGYPTFFEKDASVVAPMCKQVVY